jgi:uncharacterized membrane protein (UPF0127 family)
VRRLSLALAALALTSVFLACGDDDDVATTPGNPASGSPVPGSPSASPAGSALPAITAPTVAAQDLETTEITFDNGEDEVGLTVQIADESHERSVGLMWVEEMPEDEGMVFSWGSEIPELAFYMRNTYIPLSIAFVNSAGTIVHIEDMQPLTEDLHRSGAPAMYAVEVNQGWFTDNGIEAGDRVIDIAEKVPPGH